MIGCVVSCVCVYVCDFVCVCLCVCGCGCVCVSVGGGIGGCPIPDFQKYFPGIIAIASVSIVQNNAFPTSMLKMLIPGSYFLPGKGSDPEMRGVFAGKALIPKFLETPPHSICLPTSYSPDRKGA